MFLINQRNSGKPIFGSINRYIKIFRAASAVVSRIARFYAQTVMLWIARKF